MTMRFSPPKNSHYFSSETVIKQFARQLYFINVGEVFMGPTITDGRTFYGQVEFTREVINGNIINGNIIQNWTLTLRLARGRTVNIDLRTNSLGVLAGIRHVVKQGKIATMSLSNQTVSRLRQEDDVTLHVLVVVNLVSAGLFQHEVAVLKQPQNEFGRLLKDGSFADFTFNVDDEKIKAHKVILASSSRYFEAMFKSQMIESQTSCIAVTDLKPDVIRTMLGFIYTGLIRKPDPNTSGLDAHEDISLLSSLLQAADLYQIDNLKHNCEQLLCKLVTRSSANDLIILAVSYNLDKLLKCVATFLVDQYDDYGGGNNEDPKMALNEPDPLPFPPPREEVVEEFE